MRLHPMSKASGACALPPAGGSESLVHDQLQLQVLGLGCMLDCLQPPVVLLVIVVCVSRVRHQYVQLQLLKQPRFQAEAFQQQPKGSLTRAVPVPFNYAKRLACPDFTHIDIASGCSWLAPS